MSDDVKLNSYFERIGFSGSIAPNLQTLDVLHRLHPAAIPFENLDPLMGVPVSLNLRDIEGKLLGSRRGGHCLEHNVLFLAVLRTLGFEARGHLARVLWNSLEGAEPSPTHMVISVDLLGTAYLADVGFGGLSLTGPLKLRSEVEQDTPNERFRLTEAESTWRLEVEIAGSWRPVYLFDIEEKGDADFSALNQQLSSGPEPRMARTLMAARAADGKRFALRNDRLNTYGGPSGIETRRLESVVDIKEALSDVFGISLPGSEKLDPALSRILAARGEAT